MMLQGRIMKTLLSFVLSGFCVGSAFAGFEKWTSKDGREAELELTAVNGEGDGLEGTFRMRNGRTVTLKAADLIDEDAKRLADFSPPEAASEAGPSVFDKFIDGNLIKLEGKSVKRHTPDHKPEKFYIFYYSASWCGPCHKYTPTLVDFYNKQKPGNKSFEVILITSDSSDGDMNDYIKEKAMPWPSLKLRDAQKFKKEFKHGVTGIPSVVVCKLDGTVVAKTTSTAQLEQIVTGK